MYKSIGNARLGCVCVCVGGGGGMSAKNKKILSNEPNKIYFSVTESHYQFCDYKYIEDIQMFLLNMAFISSSGVENIYIS